MQSTLKTTADGVHVAIIMDGNGRWATLRGLPRSAGHRAGVQALRRVVEAAPGLGVGTLTVYAFSSDNWKRPPAEVSVLMSLLGEYLRRERDRCVENGVRVSVVGRRDRLPASIRLAIDRAERATRDGGRLHLRLAVDYSARDAILRAAARATASEGELTRESFSRLLSEHECAGEPSRDVDLLIRTAGEQRLSDFLLWECAYAEFVFRDTLWPDYGAAELAQDLEEFRRRERRFGALPAAAAQ